MVLLTGEGLTKAYTERKLFDGVGFTVESGDKIGIIGLNGMRYKLKPIYTT